MKCSWRTILYLTQVYNIEQISNLPDKDFKTLVIRKLTELEKIDERYMKFNKEIGYMKNRTEIYNQ